MSVSRRDFLAIVGTSVAGAAALSQVPGQAGLSSQFGAPEAAAADAGNWLVDSVGAVDKGALPIRLVHQTTGEVLLVDACRRGAGRKPVASSRAFDLYLANNGAGRVQTPKAHVLASRALARHLDLHVTEAPAPVLTMDARLSRHGELYARNDDHVG